MVEAPERIWATFEPHESGKGHPHTYATAARTKGQEYIRADLARPEARAAGKVEPRLTDAAIRAACKAHFGSELIDGINVTSKDIDWSFRDAFRRMWHGAWSALSPSAQQDAEAVEPDFAKSIASVIAEESANGAAAGWRSCTGCHETNEGYETGYYPYSKLFGCHVGSGCSECGGLGVVWEYWSKEDLEAMLEDDAPTLSDAVAEREAEPVACMWRTSWTGEKWHFAEKASFSRSDLERGIVHSVTPLHTSPPTSELEALRKRVAELEVEKIVAFNNGYVIACCNIMHLHADEVVACDVFAQLGVTQEEVAAMDLGEYDLEAIEKIDATYSQHITARRVREGGKVE